MITYILIGVVVVLFIAMLLFSATAYNRFVKAYNKYIQVTISRNLTGLQFANYMILKSRLKTKIYLTEEKFADSYFYKKNHIVLSTQVANTSSIAGVAITAHELGHALQHKNKNFLFVLSNILAFISRVGKFILLPLVLAGIVLLFFAEYNYVGQILLIVSACFIILSYMLKLVNIPVEYGASKIAYNFLKDNKILNKNELKLAKKMLNIAGQTYIASLFIGFVRFFNKLGGSF